MGEGVAFCAGTSVAVIVILTDFTGFLYDQINPDADHLLFTGGHRWEYT